MLPAQASLARTYLALGQSGKAIPYLKAALPIDDDGSLHYQLGRAYQASGQVELARQTLKEYQKIHDQQETEKQSLNRDIQITPPQSELRLPIFRLSLRPQVQPRLPGL
jgi:tetratricopeptide (TPR) repeat protein